MGDSIPAKPSSSKVQPEELVVSGSLLLPPIDKPKTIEDAGVVSSKAVLPPIDEKKATEDAGLVSGKAAALMGTFVDFLGLGSIFPLVSGIQRPCDRHNLTYMIHGALGTQHRSPISLLSRTHTWFGWARSSLSNMLASFLEVHFLGDCVITMGLRR